MRLQPPVGPPRPPQRNLSLFHRTAWLATPQTTSWVTWSYLLRPFLYLSLAIRKILILRMTFSTRMRIPECAPVVFPLAWGKILARLARHVDPRVYPLDHPGHPPVRGVPVVSQVVAARLVRCIPVPGWVGTVVHEGRKDPVPDGAGRTDGPHQPGACGLIRRASWIRPPGTLFRCCVSKNQAAGAACRRLP